MDRRLLFGVLAGTVLTLGAAGAYVYLSYRASRHYVEKTGLGELRVPLHLLEDRLTRLGHDIESVKRLKVRVRPRQEGLHVHCRVLLKPEATTDAALDRLRNLAVGVVERILGPTTVHVRLDVTAPAAQPLGSPTVGQAVEG